MALTAYYLYAESSLAYIVGDHPKVFVGLKCCFLVSIFVGTMVVSDVIWAMADIGYGLMAWTNVIAILFVGHQGVRIVKDYTDQRAQGIKKPSFVPKSLGLEPHKGIWDQEAD